MSERSAKTQQGITGGGFRDHLDRMVALVRSIPGRLTDREVRFLALAGATLPPQLGEILEIGSFMGKSTTVLAKSARLSRGARIVAVDPLTLSSPTDPSGTAASLPSAFKRTLDTHGVTDVVEFHQVRSQELAEGWDRPLRLLWVDGDHTYAGASDDLEHFLPYLRPGAVVAMHDVLNPFDGPVRAFCERILASPLFGPCGVCGSIGWGQFLGTDSSARYSARKRVLHRKLMRLVPLTALAQRSGVRRWPYKLVRSLVPRGEIDPAAWSAEIRGNLPTEASP